MAKPSRHRPADAAECRIGCGPYDVRLVARPARYLRVLQAAAGPAPPPPKGSKITLRLDAGRAGAGTVRHPTGRERVANGWLAGALVQGLLIRGLEAWARKAIALHAAVLVSPDGRGVVLPAASGTGKSTAALALAARGWRCLSDDVTYWFPQHDFVCGTDMAIALKQPAPPVLERQLAGWRHLPLRFRDPAGRFASRQTYHQPPTGLPWKAPLRGVAFLARGRGRARIRTLSPGEGLARLWPLRVAPVSGPPPRRLPALGAVAGWLGKASLVEIRTGRIADVAPAIERWLQ